MCVLSLALVALSLVAVQGGTIGCLHGSSFWCQSAENADKCGMTEYCAKNVWKSISEVVGGDEVKQTSCGMCYTIYNQLHMFYDDGGDMDILSVLDRTICNNGNEMCLKSVAKIYSRIEDFVNAEDAQSACTMFELCSATKMYIEATEYQRLVNGIQCTGCQYIISEIKSAVAELSSEELEKLMEQACETMDSKEEKECATLAVEYVTMVKSFIETLDGEELCTDFKLCNDDYVTLENFKMEINQIMTASLAVAENDALIQGDNNNNNNNNNINACSVCKIAISVAEMQLKVINLTLSTGNYIINQLCGMFGYDFCYKIQQTIMNIQSKLSNILDPSQVCQMLNVCSGSTISSSEIEPSLEVKQVQKIVKKFLDSFKK
ncbi:Prosaposin-like [Oopsacas minuta]|uniref:Prosaposin-like n=1 Tax=Oopsacas minuta TaxID=111878 RepID=A0AAV7JKD1_9METZ|nr:Prosaposin-like [Oopsacas minuta]